MSGAISPDILKCMLLTMDEFLYPLDVKYNSKYQIYIDTPIKDFKGWQPFSNNKARIMGEEFIRYGLETCKIRLRPKKF